LNINNMLISVIIPTYNRAHYLPETINSVLLQDNVYTEIIVIDDGSTDNTKDVVDKYEDKVRYVYQKNSGPSAARNNGIIHANGNLIAFLDSDDIWQPDKLSKQSALFVKNPSLGIVATGFEMIDTDYNILFVQILLKNDLENIKKKNYYKNFFPTPTVLIKKECFEKVGLFNEELHYAEDWEMWIRVMEEYTFGYIPESLVRVRSHPVSITTTSISNNLTDWLKVINIHSADKITFKNAKLRGMRLSWFYLNKSVVFRETDNKLESLFMAQSILYWPFWFPKRYYYILKTTFKAALG